MCQPNYNLLLVKVISLSNCNLGLELLMAQPALHTVTNSLSFGSGCVRCILMMLDFIAVFKLIPFAIPVSLILCEASQLNIFHHDGHLTLIFYV